MKTKKTKQSKPGRPSYKMVFPPHAKQFTIGDLFEANGVDHKTGKGENCSAQTIRSKVNELIELKMLERVKDKVAAPHGEHKGRKQFVFRRITGTAAPVKRERKEKVVTAVQVTEANQAYEATKAELGVAAPAPEPTAETAPAPTAETPVAA